MGLLLVEFRAGGSVTFPMASPIVHCTIRIPAHPQQILRLCRWKIVSIFKKTVTKMLYQIGSMINFSLYSALFLAFIGCSNYLSFIFWLCKEMKNINIWEVWIGDKQSEENGLLDLSHAFQNFSFTIPTFLRCVTIDPGHLFWQLRFIQSYIFIYKN